MDWVLDASITLDFFLPDEGSSRVQRFFADAASNVFWVPQLWWYEIANGFAVARNRKRVDEQDVVGSLQDLEKFSIQTDLRYGFDAVRRLYAISRDHQLSCYDAAYLELADRRGIPLASTDARLNAAARRAGIKIATA